MHRRIAPLLLAALIAIPVVAPANAAEPAVTPSPEPNPIVSPEPTPTGAPPSADPSDAPPTDPAGTDPTAPDAGATPTTSVAPSGEPDATGRYIVMLRTGTDTASAVAKAGKRDGVKADRSYGKAFRGFSAKLDKHQKAELLADPSVVAVVPDEVIQVTAQSVPTGVRRVNGLVNPIAKIDGTDERVDADVAIVDTGISPHPDLNIAGGYNCSTSDHSAWGDDNHHGTHVAGTVAALDNGFGVVGIAPGARVWGVKILNADGYGLISWYICGLDWILAQRDPNDANRPLFEAVNMSVTKPGSDDGNCGLANHDPLHQAICRVVAGGITVVAAAANDSHSATKNVPAAYDEVITVSALADTDGKPGGLGGNACYSWGGYDKDDTFADFSNYGYDVDIMAPGKCIVSTVPGGGYASLSGTSMAAPAVTGAVALYKSSRPNATPAEVREALRYLGNYNWKTWTDPDPTHEPLLDVSRLGDLGTFSLAPGSATPPTVEGNSTVAVPVSIVRSPTFFERVALSVTALPDGWSASPSPASLMGWNANSGAVSVHVPLGTAPGSYTVDVQGTNQGRTMSTTLTVNIVADDPTAQPPTTSLVANVKMATGSTVVQVGWPAASDPTSPIGGYEVEVQPDGGAWGGTVAVPASQRSARFSLAFDAVYLFRVRAVDTAGNWSPWVEAAGTSRVHAYDDRSTHVAHKGSWTRATITSAYRATLTGARQTGAKISLTFSGHSVAVVAPKSAHLGRAKLWIDGVFIGTLNMKATSSENRQVVFARYFGAGGSHKITLQMLGTGSHPLVRLDAFVVGR